MLVAGKFMPGAAPVEMFVQSFVILYYSAPHRYAQMKAILPASKRMPTHSYFKARELLWIEASISPQLCLLPK